MYKVCLRNNRILLPTIEVSNLDSYLNHKNNILSETNLSWSFGILVWAISEYSTLLHLFLIFLSKLEMLNKLTLALENLSLS